MQPDHRIVTRLSALVSSLTRYIIKPIPTRFRFLNIILAIALCLASLGGLTPSQSANAATLSVTSTADSGAGTLRQAVLDAAAGDTIKTNLPDPSTIALTSEIIINKDLVIQGQGASSTFLSGGNTNRIFNVTSGTLRLSAVTLQNGRSKGGDGSIPNPGGFNGAGGAVMIASGAGMTATDVNFNNNTAIGGKGGDAIWTGCGACGGGGGGDGGYGGGGGGSRTAVAVPMSISAVGRAVLAAAVVVAVKCKPAGWPDPTAAMAARVIARMAWPPEAAGRAWAGPSSSMRAAGWD
jgi:hypothetical protein